MQGERTGKIIFSRIPQEIISHPWVRNLINETVLACTATAIQGDLLSLHIESTRSIQAAYSR